jgi:hypothetical protein
MSSRNSLLTAEMYFPSRDHRGEKNPPASATQPNHRLNKAPYPNMAPFVQYLIPDEKAEVALARSAAPYKSRDPANKADSVDCECDGGRRNRSRCRILDCDRGFATVPAVTQP